MLGSILKRSFSLLGKALQRLSSLMLKFINRFIEWHRLPTWLGLANLVIYRNDLRKHNLHDTSAIDREQNKKGPNWMPKYFYQRTPNGIFNDLNDPVMGSAGSRFGRNFPLDEVWPDEAPRLYTPSPREVSRTLLARHAFKPAETINVLVAAWIQFQNHEWFDHKRDKEQFIELPLKAGDDWLENPMRIERTLNDPTRTDQSSQYPPTYLSNETHWWDGSQLYASSSEKESQLRAGVDGKLKIEENGLLPLDPAFKDDKVPDGGVELTGFNANYWVGLSLLHNLFAKEHNAICDRLKREYPAWNDDRLFATARLINAALMAKIHTVEWTPAILGHPALQIGMQGNWWGLLTERFTKILGRFGDSEIVSGIPGSPQDHHTAPYYITEEFVSVYRLHPLIPDAFEFYSLTDSGIGRSQTLTFDEIQGVRTRAVMNQIAVPDLFYSLGIANAGAVTLHNYPEALRKFQRPDGHVLDLATVDIMRDRERGVPRYNRFRELLRKPRIQSFNDLTDHPQWAQELKELYNNDIDSVDLMIGLYAEPLPEGFGFSDTAFRIFILMASRRLKSDRFFTDDFRPEIYTHTGIDWVNQNGFKSVLLRHYPEVAPALHRVANPFSPWQRVSNSNPSL